MLRNVLLLIGFILVLGIVPAVLPCIRAANRLPLWGIRHQALVAVSLEQAQEKV